MTLVIVALMSAGLTAGLLPGLLIPWLRHTNRYDVPTSRSSHQVPTPRGGGLALIAAAVVGAASVGMLHSTSHHSADLDVFWPLISLSIAMALLGLLEDFRGLGIRLRLVSQAGIAALAAWWLLADLTHDLSWLLVASFAILVYVNVANFMDGINGISGLHGAISGATYLAFGYHVHNDSIEVGAAILLAASAAFLPWNAPRALLFLGDCGSYFIGAAVAGLAISVVLSGGTVELAVAPASVYLADAMWTIACRTRRGETVYESHRSHVYQRLTDLELSHMTSAALVSTATVVVVVLAALGSSGGNGLRSLADVTSGLVLLAYLALPRSVRSLRGSTADNGRDW